MSTRPREVTAKQLRDAEAARRADAGLHYASDEQPGISRRRSGKGFSYRNPDGSLVRDEETLARIRALVIPPAWTDVWISTDPLGHVQATGRDVKRRKQYRYHDRWRTDRDAAKFDKLHAFGRSLPDLRDRLDAALEHRELDHDRAVALVVALLDTTLIRVGNEEYATENDSYGLTTLRKHHASVAGDAVVFSFRGKSGREHEVGIRDRRVARAVRNCLHLPGQHLFRYRNGVDEWCDVTSNDVNAFLADACDAEVTAKTFRTWGATVEAVRALAAAPEPESERAAERSVVAAVDQVAARLGNTRAVARSSYIHPVVLDAFRTGHLPEVWRTAQSSRNVDRAERATLNLLG